MISLRFFHRKIVSKNYQANETKNDSNEKSLIY
jgi:hypothetical protein